MCDPRERTYIGDDIEVRFDGYYVWLHFDEAQIAIEPGTMAALVRYYCNLTPARRNSLKGIVEEMTDVRQR